MTIAEWLGRGKEALQGVSPQRKAATAVLAASVAAFGLGVVSSKDWSFDPSEPASSGQVASIQGVGKPAPQTAPPSTPPAATSGTYVASKSGSKFYLPTCSGAKRIKAENQVWFDTEEAAKAAGYEAAAACKGL